MNHKYSTILLLVLFFGVSTFIVLGELSSDEITYGLCPNLNMNDGGIYLLASVNNVWNCTKLQNSGINLTVNNVTVYVNTTDYWGNYLYSQYNLSKINQSSTFWFIAPTNNLTTNYSLLINSPFRVDNWVWHNNDTYIRQNLYLDGTFNAFGNGIISRMDFGLHSCGDRMFQGFSGGCIGGVANGIAINGTTIIGTVEDDLIGNTFFVDTKGGLNGSRLNMYGGYGADNFLRIFMFSGFDPLTSRLHVDGNINGTNFTANRYFYSNGTELKNGGTSSSQVGYIWGNNSGVAESYGSVNITRGGNITFNTNGTGVLFGVSNPIKISQEAIPVNEKVLQINTKGNTNNGFVFIGKDMPTFNAPKDTNDNLVVVKKSDVVGTTIRTALFVAEYNGSSDHGQSLVGFNAIAAWTGNGSSTATSSPNNIAGRYAFRQYGTGTTNNATGVAGEVQIVGGIGASPFGTVLEAVDFRTLKMGALTGNIVNGYGFKDSGADKSSSGNFTNYYAFSPVYNAEDTTTTPQNYYAFFLPRSSPTGATNNFHWGEKGTNIGSPSPNVLSINATTVKVASNLIPTTNNTYTLGNDSHRWNNVYAVNVTTGDLIFKNGFYISEPTSGEICLYNQTGAKRWCVGQNGVLLNTTGAAPTCDVSQRGRIYVVFGAVGVADIVQVCLKSALDVYAWVPI